MYISICGNIGCGKSSLCEGLANVNNFKIVKEPIEMFSEILDLYYKNPKKWSLSLQFQILYVFNFLDLSSNCITERSAYESNEIFANALTQIGFMNNIEYEIYKNFYNLVNPKQPDIFIYIQTDPIICYNRIKKRNRKCEQNIDIDYLTKLHLLYEHTFNNKKNVFVIDGSKPINIILTETLQIISQQLV